jgi:hypothetical protein
MTEAVSKFAGGAGPSSVFIRLSTVMNCEIAAPLLYRWLCPPCDNMVMCDGSPLNISISPIYSAIACDIYVMILSVDLFDFINLRCFLTAAV